MPFERISIDPRICHGQACVKGTRIPVHQIVRMLANGDTVEDLLAEYPSLAREDIVACLDYAAELTEGREVEWSDAWTDQDIADATTASHENRADSGIRAGLAPALRRETERQGHEVAVRCGGGHRFLRVTRDRLRGR